MYNFEDYITRQLNAIRLAHSNLHQYTLEITTEQAFLKKQTFDPNTIYFLIKYLSSTQTYEGEITPIQVIALTEQNGLEDTRFILGEYASTFNYAVYTDGTTRIKQEYQSPLVLSNFNEVDFGYRSLVSISGTLYIQRGVADLEDLTIDGLAVNTLGTNLNYSMTGNTQPVGSSNLATTVKNVSMLNLSFSLPSISAYSTLITKIMNISNGSQADTSFDIAFKINSVKFGYFASGDAHLYFRLQSMQFITAPNSIPSIQLGFIL